MSEIIIIPISILSVEDDAFPIWLSFELIDRHGERHEFIEKAPVILDGDLPDKFPAKAYIRGRLVKSYKGYSRVSLEDPLGISSLDGQSEFDVLISAQSFREGYGAKPETFSFFDRLLPAALITAGFAALAHAILVVIAARSIGLELIYIIGLTFIVALIVSIIGGAALLGIVAALKLKPIATLALFFIFIQLITIELEMLVFEIEFKSVSWQYLWVSIPSAIIAWYFSVVWAHKRNMSA